jgi:hypothetical protein
MLTQSRVTEERVSFVVLFKSLKINKVSSIQLSQQGHIIRVCKIRSPLFFSFLSPSPLFSSSCVQNTASSFFIQLFLHSLSFFLSCLKTNSIPASFISFFFFSFLSSSFLGKLMIKAVPQLRRLVAGFPQRRPGFEPRSGHVGFVVDNVALRHWGRFFPSASFSPVNYHSTDCPTFIIITHHPGLVQ